MKIAIGKVNSKLIFNRNSKDALRSSTNGNVSAYAIYKVIRELSFNFYNEKYNLETILVGDNDIKEPTTKKADIGFFVAGIIEKNDEDKVIKYLNNYKDMKWILFADDPRTLFSLSQNEKLENMPNIILSQFNGVYKFKNKFYYIRNIHQEMSELSYNYISSKIKEEYNYKKINTINVLCNLSDNKRQVKLIKYIDYFSSKGVEFNIYGRIDKDIVNNKNFKGELPYKEAQEKLKESIATLCLPIENNWVTSKYVEAINNYCIPLLSNDYGEIFYDFEKYIFDCPEVAYELYKDLCNKENYIKSMLEIIFNAQKIREIFLISLKGVISQCLSSIKA